MGRNGNGIAERVSGLGDRAKERMTHARLEKLDRDNDRLRGEVAMLRDDLQEERGALREALKTLGDERSEPVKVRQGPHVMRTVVIAGTAYLLGTRAGRARYEQIMTRVRDMAERLRRPNEAEDWQEPEVRAVGTIDRDTGSVGGPTG